MNPDWTSFICLHASTFFYWVVLIGRKHLGIPIFAGQLFLEPQPLKAYISFLSRHFLFNLSSISMSADLVYPFLISISVQKSSPNGALSVLYWYRDYQYVLAGLLRHELRGRSLNMVIVPTKSMYVDAIKDSMPKKGSLHSKWDIQGLRKLIGRGSLNNKRNWRIDWCVVSLPAIFPHHFKQWDIFGQRISGYPHSCHPISDSPTNASWGNKV